MELISQFLDIISQFDQGKAQASVITKTLSVRRKKTC